jgi:hypothetical protein
MMGAISRLNVTASLGSGAKDDRGEAKGVDKAEDKEKAPASCGLVERSFA